MQEEIVHWWVAVGKVFGGIFLILRRAVSSRRTVLVSSLRMILLFPCFCLSEVFNILCCQYSLHSRDSSKQLRVLRRSTRHYGVQHDTTVFSASLTFHKAWLTSPICTKWTLATPTCLCWGSSIDIRSFPKYSLLVCLLCRQESAEHQLSFRLLNVPIEFCNSPNHNVISLILVSYSDSTDHNHAGFPWFISENWNKLT